MPSLLLSINFASSIISPINFSGSVLYAKDFTCNKNDNKKSKRKDIDPDQLGKYQELFEKYFLKSFTSRLTDYSDPKISVLSSEKVNEKYTIVKTMLLKTDKKPEVKIDWRVYTKDPNKPLIRDLIVEGLSLARTQKEEFASILNSNNNEIDALFQKLEEFINN